MRSISIRRLVALSVALSVALVVAPSAVASPADESTELNGGVEISPGGAIDLGRVAVGDAVTATWTVTNTSTGRNWVEFDPGWSTVVRCDGEPGEPYDESPASEAFVWAHAERDYCAAEEVVATESASAECDVLEPGASCELSLTFVPDAEGTYYPTARVSIYEEVERWGTIAFRIADWIHVAARVFAAAPGHTPADDPLLVSPRAHDFGEVAVGETATATSTVTNATDEPLPLALIDRGGEATGFATSSDCGWAGREPGWPVESEPVTVEPGQRCTLTFEFTPDAAEPVSETTTVQFFGARPGTTSFDIELSGEGVDPNPLSPVQEGVGKLVGSVGSTLEDLLRRLQDALTP